MGERSKKVILDTITTRFLMLFIIVSIIPLFSLILFTLSILQGYQQRTIARQEIMMETALKSVFQKKQQSLDGFIQKFQYYPEIKVASPLEGEAATVGDIRSRTGEGEGGRERAWFNNCGLALPEAACFIFRPKTRDILLPGGKTMTLCQMQQADPDFFLPLKHPENAASFSAFWHGNLYLFRWIPGITSSDTAFIAGLPVTASDIQLLFQENPTLMSQVGLISIFPANKAQHWLFYLAPDNVSGPDLKYLSALPPNIPYFSQNVNILHKPYHALQFVLYGGNNQPIARLVSLLPIAEQQLLLGRYFTGIYIVLVAGLLLSVSLAIMASRTITQPLLSLIQQVRQFKHSQNTALRVTAKGVYEINELTAAFNQMLEQLNQDHQRKDEFVTTLTHDLKVPLLAEKQTLQYLERNIYGTLMDAQREVIHILLSANQANLNLVNSILEIYRYESGQAKLNYTEFNLVTLLEEVIQELKPLALEKYIHLECVATLPLYLQADRQEIRRVLMNLIGNAVTLTPKHGKIRCVLGDRNSLEAPQDLQKFTSFAISSLKKSIHIENHVILSIQDNGLGFTEADIGQVFQRFAANRSRNPIGIGLGLYNAYQVITAHGGNIWVESTENEGAAVNFTLPRHAATSQAVNPYEHSRQTPESMPSCQTPPYQMTDL